MPNTVSTAEARKKFAEIVNKVAYGNEPVVLTRRGVKIAALISMQELELLQLIENHIDIEDARIALSFLSRKPVAVKTFIKNSYNLTGRSRKPIRLEICVFVKLQ